MPEIIAGNDGSDQATAIQEEAQKVADARAALADEALGDQQAQPQTEGDPDIQGILNKYQSPEELARAYQNMQREYTRMKQGLPPQEQQQNGNEQKADTARQERAETIARSILEQAGGQEQYGKLARWAVDNLPEERQQRYNAALASGNVDAVLTELKGLQYDYMMANGYEPRLAGGRASAVPEVQPFKSVAEVTQAMSDPRYSGPMADPSYIAEVENRLRYSQVLNPR